MHWVRPGDRAPAPSGGATSEAARCRGGCVWPSGGSLEAIAAAKAGIMKHGRPVVLARQSDVGVSEVLRRQAGLLGCPVIDAPQRVQLRSHGLHMEHDSVRESCSIAAQSRGAPLDAGERPACSMKILPWTMLPRMFALHQQSHAAKGRASNVADITMQMVGAHQLDNATAAAAAALELQDQGFQHITWDSTCRGLSDAMLPGRFQVGTCWNSLCKGVAVC